MAGFSTTVSLLRITAGNPVHFLIFFCKKKTAIGNGWVFNDSFPPADHRR
jgi:hypothetical protein